MAESFMAPADRRKGVTRRGALRAAAGAAGLAAAGAVLAACGTGATGAAGASTSAQPQPVAVKYKILWRPWYNFNNANSKTGQALMMQGIQPWLDKNPGVEVDITYLGYQGSTVTALLAGTGPDIFADWVLPLYTSGGNNLLLDLTKYVRQNNVDLTIFPQRDMASFAVSNAGLYALPSYLHLQAPAVNLGVLDSLGLTYPENGWTHKEWETLYRKATVKSTDPKKKIVGGQFIMGGYDYSGTIPCPFYLAGFGGEYVDPTDGSKCYLNAPGSNACLEWLYQLLWDGACDTGGADLRTGHRAVGTIDTAGGLISAAQQWAGVKWQIYDEPTYPSGKFSYAASDFYAISAATKNPDLVWDFMDFLCVKPDWQRWMTKLALNGPNQKSLYEEWVATVKSIAPPLANIDLDAFNRAMQANSPYFGQLFKYASTQAGNAIVAGLGPVQAQKKDLSTALTQVTNQVDALEVAQTAIVGQMAGMVSKFPTTGPEIAPVPTGI